jgi:predicted N-acetyltransferase YhbS
VTAIGLVGEELLGRVAGLAAEAFFWLWHPMDLRPVTPGELALVAALVNTAYRGGEGWTTEAAYITGERTDAETLSRDLAAQPQAQLLVLPDAEGGSLIGCVWLEPAEAAVWYLGMLTVRPDLQEQKLGRRLLEAAERRAAARGATRIRITVVNVRDGLIAWYQRRGYALTGETRTFPYEAASFGVPKRPDLAFVVLEKPLASGR